MTATIIRARLMAGQRVTLHAMSCAQFRALLATFREVRA